jgi:hypothetical protein
VKEFEQMTISVKTFDQLTFDQMTSYLIFQSYLISHKKYVSGAVITTLCFLRNLQIGPIS